MNIPKGGFKVLNSVQAGPTALNKSFESYLLLPYSIFHPQTE